MNDSSLFLGPDGEPTEKSPFIAEILETIPKAVVTPLELCDAQTEKFLRLMSEVKNHLRIIIPESLLTDPPSFGENEDRKDPVNSCLKRLEAWKGFIQNETTQRPRQQSQRRSVLEEKVKAEKRLAEYKQKSKTERRAVAEEMATLKASEVMKMRELERLQKKRESLEWKESAILNQLTLIKRKSEQIEGRHVKALEDTAERTSGALRKFDPSKEIKKASEFDEKCVGALKEIKINWSLAGSDQMFNKACGEGNILMSSLPTIRESVLGACSSTDSEILALKWSNLVKTTEEFGSLLELAKSLEEATTETSLVNWKSKREKEILSARKSFDSVISELENRLEEKKFRTRLEIEREKISKLFRSQDPVEITNIRYPLEEKAMETSSGEVFKDSITKKSPKKRKLGKTPKPNNFLGPLVGGASSASLEGDDRGSGSNSDGEENLPYNASKLEHQPPKKRRKLGPKTPVANKEKLKSQTKPVTKKLGATRPGSNVWFSDLSSNFGANRNQQKQKLLLSSDPPPTRTISSSLKGTSSVGQRINQSLASSSANIRSSGLIGDVGKKPFVQEVKVFNQQYSISNSNSPVGSELESPCRSAEDSFSSEEPFFKDIKSFVTSGQGRAAGLKLLDMLGEYRRKYEKEPKKCFDPNDPSQYGEIKRFKETYGVVSLTCEEYAPSRFSGLHKANTVTTTETPTSPSSEYLNDHEYSINHSVVIESRTSPGVTSRSASAVSSNVSFARNDVKKPKGVDTMKTLTDSFSHVGGGTENLDQQQWETIANQKWSTKSLNKAEDRDSFPRIGSYSSRVASNWLIVGLIDEVRTAFDFQKKIRDEHLKVLKEPGYKYIGLSDHEIGQYAQKVYDIRKKNLNSYILPKLRASKSRDKSKGGNLFLVEVPELDENIDLTSKSTNSRFDQSPFSSESLPMLDMDVSWIPWYFSSRGDSELNSNCWNNPQQQGGGPVTGKRSTNKHWQFKLSESEYIDNKSVVPEIRKKKTGITTNVVSGEPFYPYGSQLCDLPQWGEGFQLTSLNVFFPGNHSSLRRFFGEKWSLSSINSATPPSLSNNSNYHKGISATKLTEINRGAGGGAPKSKSSPQLTKNKLGGGARKPTNSTKLPTNNAGISFLQSPKPYDFWNQMAQPTTTFSDNVGGGMGGKMPARTPLFPNTKVAPLPKDKKGAALPKIKKMSIMSSTFFNNDVQGGAHNGYRCPEVIEEMETYVENQLLRSGLANFSLASGLIDPDVPLPVSGFDAATVTNHMLSFQNSKNKETFVNEVNVHPLVHSGYSWVLRDCCKKAWIIGSNVADLWDVSQEELSSTKFSLDSLFEKSKLIAEPQAVVLSHQSHTYGLVVGVPTTVGQWEETYSTSSGVLKNKKRKRKSNNHHFVNMSNLVAIVDPNSDNIIEERPAPSSLINKKKEKKACPPNKKGKEDIKKEGTHARRSTPLASNKGEDIPCRCLVNQKTPGMGSNVDNYPEYFAQGSIWAELPKYQPPVPKKKNKDVLERRIKQQYTNRKIQRAKIRANSKLSNAKDHPKGLPNNKTKGGPTRGRPETGGEPLFVNEYGPDMQRQNIINKDSRKQRAKNGTSRRPDTDDSEPKGKTRQKRGSGGRAKNPPGTGIDPPETKKGRPSKFKYFSNIYQLKELFLEREKLASIEKFVKSFSLGESNNVTTVKTENPSIGGEPEEQDLVTNFFSKDYFDLLDQSGNIRPDWIERLDDEVADFLLSASSYEDPNRAQVLPMHASVTLISECMDLVSVKDGMVINLDIGSYEPKTTPIASNPLTEISSKDNASIKIEPPSPSGVSYVTQPSFGGSMRINESKQRECDKNNDTYQGVYNIIGGHSLSLVLGMHDPEVLELFKKCCNHVFKAYCEKKGLTGEVGEKRLNKIRATVVDCLATELFPTPIYGPSGTMSVWNSKLPFGFWRYDVDQQEMKEREYSRSFRGTPLDENMQKCNRCGGDFGGNGNVFPSGVPQYCMGIFFSPLELAERNNLIFDPVKEPKEITEKKRRLCGYPGISQRSFHDAHDDEKVNEICLSGVTFKKSPIVCKSQSPDGKVASLYGYKNPSIEATGLAEISKISKIPYFGPTDSPCGFSVVCLDTQEEGAITKSQWGTECCYASTMEEVGVFGMGEPVIEEKGTSDEMIVEGQEQSSSLLTRGGGFKISMTQKGSGNVAVDSVISHRMKPMGADAPTSNSEPSNKTQKKKFPSHSITTISNTPLCEEELIFGVFKALSPSELDTNAEYRASLIEVPNRYSPKYDFKKVLERCAVKTDDPLLFVLGHPNSKHRLEIDEKGEIFLIHSPSTEGGGEEFFRPQLAAFQSNATTSFVPNPTADWILFNLYFNKTNKKNEGLFGTRFSSDYPKGLRVSLDFIRPVPFSPETRGKFEKQLIMDYPRTKEISPGKFTPEKHRDFGSEDILKLVHAASIVTTDGGREDFSSIKPGGAPLMETKILGRIMPALNKFHRSLYALLHDPEVDGGDLKLTCSVKLESLLAGLIWGGKSLMQKSKVLEASRGRVLDVSWFEEWLLKDAEKYSASFFGPSSSQGSVFMDGEGLEGNLQQSSPITVSCVIRRIKEGVEMVEWLIYNTTYSLTEEEEKESLEVWTEAKNLKMACANTWGVLELLEALHKKTLAKNVRKMMGLESRRWVYKEEGTKFDQVDFDQQIKTLAGKWPMCAGLKLSPFVPSSL